MRKRFIETFKKLWPVLQWALLTLLIISLIALGIWAAYTYENDWTGFRDYQPQTGRVERSKTLWDWLDLLIIPAVLALGALWFNWNSQKNEQRRAARENELQRERATREAQIEREIASERNQEAALQNYLDKMTELLLKEKLRTSSPEDEVRIVARTRTLTVLRSLDSERKGDVVRFLIGTNLVSGKNSAGSITPPIISLSGVNLYEADLHEADLHEADLHRAILYGAMLYGTILEKANLKGVSLEGANMEGAYLKEASLIRANLKGVNLTWANLEEANLKGARLEGVILSNASLEGAILPDNTLWTKSTDMSRFTNPKGNDREQHEAESPSDNSVLTVSNETEE